jgi:hypothetical protein
MAGGLHFDSFADLPPQMRQQVAGKLLKAPEKAALVAGEGSRPTKYHNKKTVVNGISFDSQKEARRYLTLMDAVRAGIIEDLRLQHDFTIQEAYTTPEGERIRAIRYKADFTYRVVCTNYEHICCVGYVDIDYWRDVAHQHGRGALVVEDVKSRATITKDYRLKYKLMADRGYLIREV